MPERHLTAIPPQRGRLICFEGLDGAGKTTTAAFLAKRLKAAGEEAVFLEKKATHFDDPALADRMTRLKTLIWDYGDAPIADLGDHHSLHIMAAWFAAFDAAMVAPRLAAGITVVVDNWFYKFLARFEQKAGFDMDHARCCFANLTPVDHVIFLEIDPAAAAARKSGFTQAETGNLDGLSGRSAVNFIRYQTRVNDTLRAMARAASGWLILPADGASPERLTRAIIEALPPSGGASEPASTASAIKGDCHVVESGACR
jgi:dTMP kinase